MNERIRYFIPALLILGFISLVIVLVNLPPPVDEGLLRYLSYGVAYLLVLLGPFSALIFAYYNPGPVAGLFIIAGIICALFFRKILRDTEIKITLILIPIIVWCVLGGLGSFWGLSAGV